MNINTGVNPDENAVKHGDPPPEVETAGDDAPTIPVVETPPRYHYKPIHKEDLDCKLTERDLLNTAQRISDLLTKITELEAWFDSVKAEHKSKRAKLDADVEIAHGALATHRETRSVECQEEVDVKTGTVVNRRLDTGEITETRPMNDDDRQIDMFQPKVVDFSNALAENLAGGLQDLVDQNPDLGAVEFQSSRRQEQGLPPVVIGKQNTTKE